MTKTMTAAAALLLGVALAASAQANSTMRQSTAPTNDMQQSAQTGTTAAPQVTKKQARTASKKMVARRHLAKSGGKLIAAKSTKGSKLKMASLKRHAKLSQMARLHHRSLRGQQQSTEIGSSTMPTDNSTLNTLPPTTNQPIAGSGSSTMPQTPSTTLPNQPQTQAPIR
ncbi:MAG TPA: hypothetical protein VHU15_16735 [Stellaceae bacterium]|jgi:hypothetical protein|nr:hypothetical protein [Stellaceae bacterium]